MNELIHSSSYSIIFNDFWHENYEDVERWIDKSLRTMFSNETIRILSAFLYNPVKFKHVTLMIDGHDNEITYNKNLMNDEDDDEIEEDNNYKND